MIEATEKTALLERFSVPPIFRQSGIEKMTEEAVLPLDISVSPCALAGPKHGQKFPQAIAHRGYKAAYPENSMGAFNGAVKIGAQAIETDVHITKDKVVVLSHDATLKRCFGRPDRILDLDWNYISTLWTTQEPKQRMPRLQDLLEYLASPGKEDIWLVLDIKMDNDADDIMRLIAETIANIPSSLKRPWSSRIVLGCWAAKYIPLASHYLPGFPITHIGFSLAYARQFLFVPNVSFNMLLPILMAPGGRKFIADCKAAGRPVLAWTVNDEEKMRWCIRRGIDGVLTDDPKLFLDVCKRYESRGEGEEKEQNLSWILWLNVIRVWLFVFIFGYLYRNRFAIKQKLR